MTQKQSDISYLRMAHIWAENSKARRLHVGALVVKNGTIIGDGFNGTPSGFDNNCEDEIDEYDHSVCDACINKNPERCHACAYHHVRLVTKPYVLHAEANAITKIAKSTQSSDGATLYCTDAACVECAKLMIQSGIRRFVYDRSYRDTKGIDLLKEAGIIVEQVNLNKQ